MHTLGLHWGPGQVGYSGWRLHRANKHSRQAAEESNHTSKVSSKEHMINPVIGRVGRSQRKRKQKLKCEVGVRKRTRKEAEGKFGMQGIVWSFWRQGQEMSEVQAGRSIGLWSW